MEVHSGVNAGSGYVHMISETAANVHDIEKTSNLIREDDEAVYDDSGYTDVEKWKEIRDDGHLSQEGFCVNKRTDSIKIPDTY